MKSLRSLYAAVSILFAAASLAACSQIADSKLPTVSPGAQTTRPNAIASRSAQAERGRKPNCTRNCGAYPPFPTYVGVGLPGIGFPGDTTLVTSAPLNDIQNNLKADYVRTQWVYGFWKNETVTWSEEDAMLAPICNALIPIGIILPGPEEALSAGILYKDLGFQMNKFLKRYTVAGYTVKGVHRAACEFIYAELGAEENIPKPGPGGTTISTNSYASYYGIVAPLVEPFLGAGVDSIVVAGPSGVHYSSATELSGISWTQDVAMYTNTSPLADAPTSYAVDPYGTMVSNMGAAINEIASAASSNGVTVSSADAGVGVTEIGMNDCDNEQSSCTTGPQPGNHDLLDTLIGSQSLDGVVPFVTIYNYEQGDCAVYPALT